MGIDRLYDDALRNMASTLAAFEKRVPRPQRASHTVGFVFRYVERTIEQAIIQKLARLVSGLHAARILLDAGFFQELAALQRMLDEFREDVLFLALAVLREGVTDLHREYLAAFYEEEFDDDDPLRATQRRPMVPRKKIRAYVSRIEGIDIDPSTGIEVSRTLSKAYSGFVHGASPQIMDMYGGSPPKFHVAGMLGTPRENEHREDFWNYVYRGICAFGVAAGVFGDSTLLETIRRYRDEFEQRSRAYGLGMPSDEA
jgi:hypothetical protein